MSTAGSAISPHDSTTLPDGLGAPLRREREALYAEGVIAGRSGRRFDVWPVGMTRDAGAALRDLVREPIAGDPSASGAGARPRRALETGLAFGLASSFILEGLAHNAETGAGPGGGFHLTSIDPFQTRDWDGAGVEHLTRAGAAPAHTLIEEGSETAMAHLASRGARFDFIFLDGDHRFDAVFVDLFFAARLVRPGGLVVLDDAWMPSVRKAAAFGVRNGVFFADPRPHGPSEAGASPLKRFLLLRANPDAHLRPWDHFVDF